MIDHIMDDEPVTFHPAVHKNAAQWPVESCESHDFRDSPWLHIDSNLPDETVQRGRRRENEECHHTQRDYGY